MRHLYSSVDGSDLIDSLDLGAQTAVNAENFTVDDSSDRQVIEYFGAVFPRVGITVLTVDLIIEAINCGDLSV